jgi:hypothetical protein
MNYRSFTKKVKLVLPFESHAKAVENSPVFALGTAKDAVTIHATVKGVMYVIEKCLNVFVIVSLDMNT